ncbi:Uncharacterised protein [Salmonella enterica subsp. enterica serovar Bovismorbificans]|uniref:Uncharacterized protein n=1 Tax=Salmonella enterica subsp. enterica serovar Bovismorbificans TaxID=58097 RepID=A0A655CA10_SALET|nr:Uncharacterised protein [Salmonella enterica subsp. enterica serovar Bovismorbificans]CNU99441.1 Uncharacterised protein [Salmonella enterica subsp. enterica serovar Bovismorbificans]
MREIVQHTACLCVTVTIHPDPVQSSDGSGNDVPCILRGDEQFFTGQITVVGLSYGERRCFHKHGNMPAELPFPTQLFGGTFSVLTDCLPHRFISRDSFSKASAADYLLFGGRCFLQGNTAFSIEFPDRSLQNHIKVFPDERWIRAGQLQCCGDPHCVQLL